MASSRTHWITLLACLAASACQADTRPSNAAGSAGSALISPLSAELEQHPCWQAVESYMTLLDEPARYDATSECFDQAYQQADQALNQTYQAIRKGYGPDTDYAEQLKLAQRAWIRFRDQDCQWFDIGSAGAKPLGFQKQHCLIKHTQVRTAQLKALQ